MSDYEVSGHVIDRQTRLGIEGLRVEAWDKDLIIDDLVGSTLTRQDGAFHMRFDESYFRELFFDRNPDIYFKVFRGSQLLTDTKDSVIWNVESEGIVVDLEVDGAATNRVVAEGNRSSSRDLLQATYISLSDTDGTNAGLKRGVEKAAFVKTLGISEQELGQITSDAGVMSTNPESLKRAADQIQAALSGTRATNHARLLATVDSESIMQIAERVVQIRQAQLSEFVKSASSKKEDKLAEQQRDSEPNMPIPEWDWLQGILNNLPIQGAGATSLQVRHFEQCAEQRLAKLESLISAFKEKVSSDVLPVGYLHLEKLGFTPAGIERGELSYSVPLSPGEEVNISSREWSHNEEGYEKIVTDYFEEYSEEGVAEKIELSQSVDSQRQHASAFNTSVAASYSYSSAYGDIKISNNVGYNMSESANQSAKMARNKSADITSKASSRAKREHKISFKVASAIETENQTVRKIKNPFADRPTRVDYYQLIRMWQIDLYRYGLRLTYDIVVMEPGRDLLRKLLEIKAAYDQLEEGLNFTLRPEQITLENFIDKALEYNVQLEDVETLEPKTMFIQDPQPFDVEALCGGGETIYADSIPITIPEGYKVKDTAYLSYDLEKCASHPNGWDMKVMDQSGRSETTLFRFGDEHHAPGNENLPETHVRQYDGWANRRGELAVWRRAWRIKTWMMAISIEVVPNEEAVKNWQQKIWKVIRDGAEAVYLESRQRLKEKIERLEAELAVEDSLSLRKKEREEVMKSVLEAMGFAPDQYNDDPEIIKFIHHAIEWENMLYFLYPYFWSEPGVDDEQWIFKRFLEHPDSMHRAFLKAGSARVVLTIRPGFEKAFLAFMDTGQLDQIPEHPYFTIAEEFESYAKTSYPGIPMANPELDYRPLLHPKQIKTWEDMQLIMNALDEYRKRPYATQRQAWRDMKKLMQLLKDYYLANGETYPADLAQLAQYFPDETVPLDDPWGYPYHFQIPGDHGDYDLFSYGANGQAGGMDEDMDIAMWREIEVAEYPQSLEELQAIYSGELNIPLQDRWGNNYSYECPGFYGAYDLVSYGADGQPGGDGENTDITSWAEVSLIGRWYEYTPTSALDIAFDETMPAN